MQYVSKFVFQGKIVSVKSVQCTVDSAACGYSTSSSIRAPPQSFFEQWKTAVSKTLPLTHPFPYLLPINPADHDPRTLHRWQPLPPPPKFKLRIYFNQRAASVDTCRRA